mmetsp:Transcript_32538/g.82951  ORF Transcript_32538/g.82951 Transcript_32538/m.82951 type:complete len:410 (+) Transcript_32538:522-1751(+)
MAPGSRPRARLEPGAPPLPVTASATSAGGGGGMCCGSPAGAPSSSLSSAVAAQPAPGAACCSARRGCGRTGGAVPCAAAVLCAGALCAAGVRSSAAGVRSSTGTRSTCRASAPCLPSAQEGLCLGLCLGLLRGGGLIRPSGLYLPSGGGLHRPPSARPAAAAGAAAAGQWGPPQTLEPCATARRPASSPCSMACWLTSETRRIEQRAASSPCCIRSASSHGSCGSRLSGITALTPAPTRSQPAATTRADTRIARCSAAEPRCMRLTIQSGTWLLSAVGAVVTPSHSPSGSSSSYTEACSCRLVSTAAHWAAVDWRERAKHRISPPAESTKPLKTLLASSCGSQGCSSSESGSHPHRTCRTGVRSPHSRHCIAPRLKSAVGWASPASALEPASPAPVPLPAAGIMLLMAR